MQASISASMENYLEAIYHAIEAKRVARPRDIVRSLNVNASSVTSALHWLGDHGLVNYEPFEVVTLTAEGEKVARGVVRRHQAVRRFLVDVLGIDDEEADRAACEMEHVVSGQVLERLRRFAEFVDTCPRAGQEWVARFHRSCMAERTDEDCRQCLDAAYERLRDDAPQGAATV